MKLKDMTEEAKNVLTHLVILYDEVDELKSRVKQHDTGHIKTAISVLQGRIKEIREKLLSLE